MDILKIEELLRVKPFTSLDLNVAIYSRVSTDSELQATSIVNQTTGYREIVTENPHWKFVGDYVDEGISGLSVNKRDAFNRMIDDAKHGRIDLIVTKSVARFGRNLVDTIKYTRDLRRMGVGVWFHTDNIMTFDRDYEFKLALMATFAQEESLKKAEAVKFGLHQAQKRGVVFGFDNMFGYRKKDGRLYIDEEEMPIVKTIFEMYATDKYSMRQIEIALYEKGYRNHNGNKISHATMAHMIRNPKYKGYYRGNVVQCTDTFTKKIVFMPEDQWVMFKDENIVPAIVSEELWAKANAVLDRRSKDVKNRQGLCNHPNLMTGKMYCEHCGTSYHRKESKDHRGNDKNSAWVCAGKIRNGAKTCPSRYIYEDEIKHMLFEIFKETKFDAQEYLEEYIRIFEKAKKESGTEAKVEKLKKKVEEIRKKKAKLLSYNVSGAISDRDFIDMNKTLESEQLEAEKEIDRLSAFIVSQEELDAKIADIRKAFEGINVLDDENIIDDRFVRNYIDRIDISVDEKAVHLKIRLQTGRMIERELGILRTGHRSLRMYPIGRFLFDRRDALGRDIHKITYDVSIVL